MYYCKYCGAEHDEDAAFCVECGKPIKSHKRKQSESKNEATKVPIPQFPEPIDESERDIYAKIASEKRRLLSKKEMQIDDTILVVYNCVPENCSDEQFQESCKQKIERLILNDLEHQQFIQREAEEHKKRTT